MAYLMLILTERVVDFVRTSKMWGAYFRIVYGIDIAKAKGEKIFKIIRLYGFVALSAALILGWGVISELFIK